MASYMVYFPGARRADASLLDDAGLADLRLDEDPHGLETSGPDGGRGALLAWQRVDGSDPVMAYDDVRQFWQEAPGGKFWLGAERRRPVTPDDIRRPQTYSSLPAVLADGQTWSIPVAAHMPAIWGCDERGVLVRKVRPEYESYSRAAEQVYRAVYEAGQQAIAGDAPDALPLPDAWDFCCAALGMNYRLAPAVIAFLGLIDDETFVRILHASIEMPLIEHVEDELSKKECAAIPAT